MRNLKNTDGLTKGSGMNESSRLDGCSQLWIVWGDAGGFEHCQLFFFFSYYVHVIKLVFCLKKETHYAYG